MIWAGFKWFTLMMEAVSSSVTSVNVHQTTRCNIPEDSHLHEFFSLRIGSSGGCCEHDNKSSYFIKGGAFFDQLSDC
jgi:hypothetical protein